jgi:cellobiose phosphorylase
MQYGHFSEDGLEYVITRPDTPRPWSNYLSNNEYCALITQTGGGYSFVEGAGTDRILRAVPGEMVLSDRPGRYIYVRDEESGEYWSLNWQPVRRQPDRWEARHGLGYTKISSANEGIAGELTFFVPLNENVEFWMVKLENQSGRPRKLSVWSYAEWSLGNYVGDLVERSFFNLFNNVHYDDGIIYATKRMWVTNSLLPPNEAWDKHAFMTSNGPVSGHDCSKEAFVGMYRSLGDPRGVEEGRCYGSIGVGRDPVGVLQHTITLAPGATEKFDIILGVVRRKEEAKSIKRRFQSPDRVESELEKHRRFWQEYLPKLTVQTPDPDFDLSVNVWNKYQSWITARWSRMVSLYIGGGSILGFRDTAQDILGVLPTELDYAHERTVLILRHQFADAGTVHNWDPLTNLGPRTGHSDDPLWLVMCVLNYLKETGEMGFLNEVVEYYDAGRGTVYEHMTRALDFTLSQRSHRGLSLMGYADWNDGLDQVGNQGKGESVMTSEFLAWMLLEVGNLMAKLGQQDAQQRYLSAYEDVKKAINTEAWDGEWYWRATTDEGRLLGSATNEEGKIYLNAQSWAVLGRVATGDRAIRCLDSIGQHLDTDYGPALFLPAYKRPNPRIGIITRFAPGTKENGTVFCHPVAWAVIAECILGRADRAYHYWQETSFITRGREPEVYKAEPYVYAEYIYGPDHPNFGQGEFSWTTGTAAWMWRACVDWILGVRPTLDGLILDPCVPAEWPGYSVTRNFRGATYHVRVENPNKLSGGVTSLTVDGRRIEGNLIPVFGDGAEHEVVATLGS